MKLNNVWRGLDWRGNVYLTLVIRLTIVMLLYTLCRIGFYFFNTSFFPGMTWSRFVVIMGGGLRFDLSAVLYLNSLFLLLSIIPLGYRFNFRFQRGLKYWFVFTNSIGLAANVADSVYYRYTLRRTTISVFSQFKNEQNLASLSLQFIWDYWYAVLLWALLVYALIKLYDLTKVKGPQLQNKWAYYLSGIVLIPLITYGVIGGMRGGFRHSTRPITLSNAAAYATIPKDINLVLNTPFALMRTAGSTVIEKANYFQDEKDLASAFDPVHVPHDSTAFRPDNVVVIILESFSKEFIGAYNKDLDNGQYKGYAPFMDSLISVSRAYQYSFANGRKSIDAMPSVICSIPSIEVPYVLSHYSGNKVNSLASLLKDEGYYSAFFHGAPNGSMGFQAFANMSGFNDYFGMTEYDNDDDFDNIWGIWDEPFLQFTAQKINTFKEPFFVNFFSVSSHHPYKLPPGQESKYKGGPMDIHKTIQYTDHALKSFFETASKMPWFKHTLFVFTADHASAMIQYQQYNSAWGYFSIPIFFYQPDSHWSSFDPEIIQQIDIMPTVLGYLHYPKPYVAFGRNIFDPETEPFAFNYLDNTYQAFMQDYLLQFDGTKSVGLYNFKTDKALSKNLLKEQPEMANRMERKLKAFIQQYNNRMVDDNLTTEGPQKDVILKKIN